MVFPAGGSEEEVLANLGIDINPDIAAQIHAALIAPLEQAQAKVEELSQQIADASGVFSAAFSSLNNYTQETIDSIDALAESFRNEQLQVEIDKMVALADATRAETDAASSLKAQWDETLAMNDQRAAGYGVSGGLPGPAEDDSETSVGSAFGIGHGLSVAGHALGSPGLREAGGLIYIEEALRRVGPLFDQLNASLLDSGGIIPPLTGGLAELGVPMAGLLATAIPLGIAVGVAASMLGDFIKVLDDYDKAVKAISDAQVKYYEFVATATTEDARKRIEADASVVSANERGMGNLKKTILEKMSGEGFSDAEMEKALKKGEAPPGTTFGTYLQVEPLFEQYKKLGDASDGAAKDIADLTNGIQKGDFAINDSKQSWIDQGNAAAKAAQQTADFNRQLTSDSQMSSAQIEKRIDTLKQDSAATQDQMDTLKPYIGTNAALKTQYDDLNTKLQQEKEEIGLLSTTFLDNALAAEAMKEAAKEAEKAVDDMAKANVNYAKGVQAAEDQLASQTATVKQRELDAERQYTEGSLQDTFERTKIATAESRKVLDIEQQTSDKIVDIVTKFGQKQSDLALDLRRQEEDDVTKYNDSVAKAELDARRTEQSDLTDHLQKLADIRSQDKLSQENALLNRQFGELRQLQNKEQQDIQNEDTSYQRREDKLKEHLAQQEEDLFRGLQQEEKAQTLAEQRKVEDATRTAQREIEAANLAESRKIEAAQQAEQQQLQDLTTNENYKLQLLRIGLQDELTLMAQAEAAKLQLLAATRDAIIEQVMGIPAANAQALAQLPFSPASFGGIGIGDSGGSFGANQPWMKRGLMETIDFGGRNAVNVGGSALIYPLSSGTVTPVSQSEHTVHFSPTLNIYPSSGQEIDGKQLMNEMYSQLEALLEK